MRRRGRVRRRAHTVKFWGLGREGEVVRDLVPEFERTHPGIRVIVQQIPWTAAHEKLLTGFVGGSPPDLAQLGNTWIPEFAAIGALEPLGARLAASTGVSAEAYFEGIWKTNQYGGAQYGIPWYVDTRVLFYRPDILAAAGYPEAPRTWSAWRDAMEKIRDGLGRAQLRDPAADQRMGAAHDLRRPERLEPARRRRHARRLRRPGLPRRRRVVRRASSGTASRPS